MISRRLARGRATAFVAALLLCPGAAHADPVDRWAFEINAASRRFGIPENWVRRVMRAESGGLTVRQGHPIVSRAGAIGLMQLMPGTWRDMRFALGLGANPHDPEDNIVAGTAYLRLMYDRFGYPGLFAAYNAGPARYSASLSGARPLPAETRAYVAAVAPPDIRRPGRRHLSVGIFALQASPGEARPPENAKASRSQLFVALSGVPQR